MIQWNEEEETKPKVASEEWWFQAPVDGSRDSVELRPEEQLPGEILLSRRGGAAEEALGAGRARASPSLWGWDRPVWAQHSQAVGAQHSCPWASKMCCLKWWKFTGKTLAEGTGVCR